MQLRNIFRRRKSAPPAPRPEVATGQKVQPLHYQDTLLSIASFLDADSLFNLRLVDKSIAGILKEEESWICNTIARYYYSWVFETNDSAFRDPGNLPIHLSRFSTFKSLGRLHLVTLLPALLLWNQVKDPYSQDVTLILPGGFVTAACARGLLTLWALGDIELESEELEPKWGPREEYKALSKVAGPFIDPYAERNFTVESEQEGFHKEGIHQALDGARRPNAVTKPNGGLMNIFHRMHHMNRRRDYFWSKSEAQGAAPVKIDPHVFHERSRRSRQNRLELISRLDQGSWMDLHIVTTLVLAFYISYTDSAVRRKSGQQHKGGDKILFSDWALRQGPDLILELLSIIPQRRSWAHAWIDQQWLSRPEDLQVSENMPMSASPLGISTATEGRYPHPKCDEWEAEGWPRLDKALRGLLFNQWQEYVVKENKAAQALAAALAERTGDISFQTRMS